MSYDTGEVDEDGNMIFRGKSLKGFAYVVQDSVVVLLSDVELFIIIVVVFFSVVLIIMVLCFLLIY